MQTLIEKLEVLLEAAKTGKAIQFRLTEANDWTDDNDSWKECLDAWTERRLKPTPKLRPWRLEEVPLEGWFRAKTDHAVAKCIQATNPNGGSVNVFSAWYLPERLLETFEWTLTPFDAASWKPCGVEE